MNAPTLERVDIFRCFNRICVQEKSESPSYWKQRSEIRKRQWPKEYQASYRLLTQRKIEENKEADDDRQDEEQKENHNRMDVDQIVSSIRNLDGGGQGDYRF